ncbi:MAG: hypothetical protein QOG63_422 [Thermoleophilaceae bacterium]|nr:hypothetical protein [Thermoleophilaceae bacterium]
MRRALLTTLAAAGAALAAALPAHAAYLPAATVDGPSADILGLANLDISRDGTGWVGYVKRDGPDFHVFASRLDKGLPQPPERVDVGQLGSSISPHLAVANKHRAMAVWVNGGALWASERPSKTKPWGAPVQVYSGVLPVTDPQLDVTIFGTAFVSFTVGTDVLVARKAYNGNWNVLPAPVDVDPARVASDADIAAAADGSAIVAWTETGTDNVAHVFARRITVKGQLSAFPREVGVTSFQGRPGGSADTPSVSIEDDSSYAFVAIRQDFVDAGATVSRAIGRRLVASQFEPPHAIDGLDFPTSDGAASSQIFVASRGEGIAGTARRSGQVAGQGIGRKGLGYDARWFPPARLDAGGSTSAPLLTATTTDGAVGVVAWQEGTGGPLLGSIWNATKFAPTETIAPPGVNAPLGLDSAGDARTDFVIGYAQDAAGGRQIEALAWDGPLRAAGLHTDNSWFRDARLKLDWTPLTNVVWGPVTYRVMIDGAVAGTTRKSEFVPPKPLGQGVHHIEIVQIDGRGQESPGLDRTRAIDTKRPAVALKRSHHGYRVTAIDGAPGKSSGIVSVTVVFTHGTASVPVSNGAVRRARVFGRGRPRQVIAVDEAGNRTVRSV